MSRKWKEWSVVLTGSQLIFYRDSSIALNLITELHDASNEALARYPSPRPDEVVSMKDAIAVCDSSYGKVNLSVIDWVTNAHRYKASLCATFRAIYWATASSPG